MGVGRGGSHVPQSGSLPFNAVVARGESTMIYFCPLSSPFLGPLGPRSSRGRRKKEPTPLLWEAPLPSRQRHATTAQAAAARGAPSSLPQQEVVPFCPPRGITGLAGKGGETKKGRNGQKRETEQKCFSSITPNWIVPGRRKRKGWMKKEWGGGRAEAKEDEQEAAKLSISSRCRRGRLSASSPLQIPRKKGGESDPEYVFRKVPRKEIPSSVLYRREEWEEAGAESFHTSPPPLLQGRSPPRMHFNFQLCLPTTFAREQFFFSGRRQKSGKKGEGRG